MNVMARGKPIHNAVPHDPYTYATNAAAYIQQMKAAYPAVPIKVGVVVAPGEGSYSNNATHFAVNPRTGTTNYGWTPIVLSELKSLGVLPDFLIYHFYWQYTTYWLDFLLRLSGQRPAAVAGGGQSVSRDLERLGQRRRQLAPANQRLHRTRRHQH